MKTLLKMTLEEIYLDYVNNFISIEFMAEHYGVTNTTMSELYEIARKLVKELN